MSNDLAFNDILRHVVRESGGTYSLATSSTGASGYSEGGTIGTATGTMIVFRGTGGTIQAVGTATPLPVTLASQIAGEDITNNVLGIAKKPTVSSSYSATAFGTINDADLLVKPAPGQLMSVWGSNSGTALLWLQVHNGTAAPATGGTPVLRYPLPSGTTTVPAIAQLGESMLGQGGYYLSAGIGISVSTAYGTHAPAGTADVSVGGFYI